MNCIEEFRTSVKGEFIGLGGDPRLEARTQRILEKWQEKPAVGFPQIFGESCDLSLWTRETLRADKGVSPHHLRTTSDCESHRWLSAVQEVEGRQLESYQTLKIALALTLPIAWSMLLIRLKILIAHSVRYKLPTEPTLKDVAYAIAGMGGHLKQNGPPGWQTLMRGFERLLTLEEGWLMSRKTCDQS